MTRLLDTSLLIASFGEDEGGEIYVVGLGGSIHRIVSPDLSPDLTVSNTQVAESQEGNNVLPESMQGMAELVVSEITGPGAGSAGRAVTVIDRTLNKLGGAGPSRTRFYLSVNRSWDGGDLSLGGRSIPSLGSGEFSEGSNRLTIPEGTPPGPYFIIAVADADGDVLEGEEADNLATMPITVQ
jgi:hypothetical protein